MQNLKQSLIILNIQVGSVLEAIEKFGLNFVNRKINPDEVFLTRDLSSSLMQIIILNIHSYLNEYDSELGVNSEECYKQRIKSVKDICKPFTRAIKEFSKLEEYRNMLAHQFRDKTGKLMLLNADFDNEKKPLNLLEFFFIRNCLIQTHKIISEEFKLELMEALHEMLAIKYNPPIERKLTTKNFHQIYHNLVIDSIVIGTKYGKFYDYNIDSFANYFDWKDMKQDIR